MNVLASAAERITENALLADETVQVAITNTTDSATKGTFATMNGAVQAAKSEAIIKYGPEYIPQ